ncbi:MAG: hypothetical protein ACK4IX_05485 [Candidatus Sericytochromatia bacterium]
MIKRFLTVLVAFVTVFLYQSQSWAAVNTADEMRDTITIERNMILSSDEAPAMIAAKRMGSGGTESMIWIASIFVTGLGQILMGDLWRGLKFTLVVVGAWLVSAILGVLAATLAATGGVALLAIVPVIGLLVGLVVLGVHIWNIIDAYNMSQEMSGMSKIDSAKLAQIVEETLKVSNAVKADNGSFAVKAFAF